MPTTVTPIPRTLHRHQIDRALAALDPAHRLPFRHHGIGVLQAYLNDHERLHVWHPALVLPGMLGSGAVHDHRFSMASHVLAGTLHHDEWVLAQDPQGPYQLYEVVHAKIADRVDYPAPTMVAGRWRYTATIHELAIGAGSLYTFDKRLFHRSWVEEEDMDPMGAVVTLVAKQAQEDRPARLVCPWQSTPKHAFGRPEEENAALKDTVLCRAYAALDAARREIPA